MKIVYHNFKKVCGHRKLKGRDLLTEKQIIFFIWWQTKYTVWWQLAYEEFKVKPNGIFKDGINWHRDVQSYLQKQRLRLNI